MIAGEMRLTYIEGIPHWTDGFLTLPIIAGGHKGADNYAHHGELGDPGGDEETGTNAQLNSLTGGIFYDPSGFGGTLVARQNTSGGATVYFLVSENGQRLRVTKGSLLINPYTRQGHTVGEGIIQNGALTGYYTTSTKLTDGDLERLFGGGGSPSSYSGTQGSQSQAEAAAAARDAKAAEVAAAAAALDYERQKERDRLAAENAKHNQLLQEAGSLTREIAGLKKQGRNLISSLVGVDPVRQGIVQSGGVQRGNTPAQGFSQDLQTAVDTQLPTFGAQSSNADLEAANKQYSDYINAGMPDVPQIGMAGGGTAGLEGVQFGTSKRAVMLGEGTGTGMEIGIIDPSMGGGITEVIPIAGGAEEGGSFDTVGLRQSLGRVYGNMGFTGEGPQLSRNPYGFSFAPSNVGSGADTALRLGYRPRLLRDANTGAAYFKNDAGQLQHISPEGFKAGGFRWEDFLNVAPTEINQFGPMGSDLTEAPPSIEQSNLKRSYSTQAQPWIAKTGKEEIALPAIAQLASMWRRLLPSEKLNLGSFFGTAGLGAGGGGSATQNALSALEDEIGFWTPTGTGSKRAASFG